MDEASFGRIVGGRMSGFDILFALGDGAERRGRKARRAAAMLLAAKLAVPPAASKADAEPPHTV